MQAQQQGKRAVKVSYQGETKRLKLSGAYQELIDRTRTAFKQLPQQIKFFYLDEDNEIISISSQSDYTEALEIEDLNPLRLTAAASAADARQQLLTQLEDQRPLAESLNSSQIVSQYNGGFGRQSTIERNNFMESDFDAVSHAELAQSIVERQNTVPVHEMAVGPDADMRESVSVGTGGPIINQVEAGCNTARVQSRDVMIDTCVATMECASQSNVQVRDMGCDGIIPDMQNQASQMEVVQMKEADVTCDLLIPSDDDEDAVDLEEVPCIKCNGSQVNKKGLPCRKCNGRGTLVSKELTQVAQMVRMEVQDYCYSSFKKMFTDYLEDKQAEQMNIRHEGVICDGCDKNPITGIRYMCSVRSDTDFCQDCERNGVAGQYPLLKIRKPTHAPQKLICQYNRQMMGQQMPQPAAAAQQEAHVWERQAPEVKNVRYSARFVKESFPDKHEIICGDIFCKSWWMRNDGETSWPAGTQFLQTSGDNMQAKIVTLKNEVAAGATFEISVQFKAPEQEGRYTSFFRLQTGRIKFGHKVSCDILCIKPAEPVVHEDLELESDLVQPAAQTVAMVPQDVEIAEPIVDADDKEMEVSVVIDEPVNPFPAQPAQANQQSPLMQSTLSIDVKSPKQLYFEEVEKLQDENMKQALKSLYEFGFTNFRANQMLMQKHKDVNVVAEQLMTGALSESQFGSMQY